MARRYVPRDRYHEKAKSAGLRARSAFKVAEIVERFRLVGAGGAVIDLGAAPGGFLQVLAALVGPTGSVVGVDMVPIRPLGIGWVRTLELDLFDPLAESAIAAACARPVDLLTSDAAPKTSGVRFADEARSIALCERAMGIGDAVLRRGGSIAVKLFMGGGFGQLRAELRQRYSEVKVARPEATRPGSVELYLIGLGKLAPSKQGA